MSAKLPYLSTPGNIDKILSKIQLAATPPNFNYDFVEAKLQLKGGSGRAIPPFFKRLGMVSESGAPTALYQKFRNTGTSREALGEAIRHAYKQLYEANEYAHDLSEKDLKGLVLQVTGLEDGNRTAELIQSTYSRLKKHASFDGDATINADVAREERAKSNEQTPGRALHHDLRIGYTINLNLPATTNIEVFDAIFQSLRKNLLQDD